MQIEYKEGNDIDINSLKNLYNDAEWYNYTNDLAKLKRAYDNSVYVISAWDNNELIGILRAVGDSETIMYIQDIIVLNKYKRRGIGKTLINKFMTKYIDVRQKVLMTDNTEETVSFYKSCGFVPTEKYDGIAFVNYNVG